MNKRDIRLEVESRVKELRSWVAPLEEASPALARAFLDLAVQIESRGPGAFDSYGATMMAGKVNGLVLAAHTLLEELKRNRS
jgi:hypothetical protein